MALCDLSPDDIRGFFARPAFGAKTFVAAGGGFNRPEVPWVNAAHLTSAVKSHF